MTTDAITWEWNNVTVRRAKQFDGLALNRERGTYTPIAARAMTKIERVKL